VPSIFKKEFFMCSIAEMFFADGDNILQHGVAGNTETFVGYLPTAGIKSISMVILATMGNSTDMNITIKTADDAAGTNPTALTQTCPVYRDGVRQTDAKAIVESQATGDYFHVVEIPAAIIPAGKYIGVYADAGSASNKYSAIAIEDTYYKG
jgi:hypothetical protein